MAEQVWHLPSLALVLGCQLLLGTSDPALAVPDAPTQLLAQLPIGNPEEAAPTSAEDPTDPPAEVPQGPEGTIDLRTGSEAPATESDSDAGSADQAGEPEVLVAEVLVTGTENQDLVDEVYGAIATRAGTVTTRSQLQADINAVFATGFFADVKATPSDTDLGVRVTFEVRPNPVLKAVQTEGATVLPPEILTEVFADQQNAVLNFGDLQAGVQQVEAWYTDNGYVLAKVTDVRSSEDGTVTLEVVEGTIEDVQVQGNDRTRDFIITREIQSQSGEIFNRNMVQQDIEKVFNLNLFQDVNVSLDPGSDPEEVVVVFNVEERRTGSLGATAGVSSASGVFGGVNLSEQNLGGNNQSASFNIQVGTNETLFDLDFTDPRIANFDVPTSYNINLSNRQSSSFVFDEGFSGPGGESIRITRLGGGTTFSRPVGNEWRASLGVEQQFVEARDGDGNQLLFDSLGNPISFSDGGQDSYTNLRLGVVRDTRNNQLLPTGGSVVRASTTQSVPLLENSLTANRLQASYSTFIPVDLLRPGNETQEVLAFDLRAGSVVGDLAPYDAFTIGGGNSVRGFFEGNVGSGRSFAQATAELRFPLFNPVGGVLFVDYGTDLGSGSAVAGNPAGVRGKPGSGVGIGAGVRIQSPLGPLRIDYGIGQGGGDPQLHFGIGEKF